MAATKISLIAIALLSSTLCVEAFIHIPRHVRPSPPASIGEQSLSPVTLYALEKDNTLSNSPFSDSHSSLSSGVCAASRRDALRRVVSTLFLGAMVSTRYATPAAAQYTKSYSSNARNLDRISAGDMSGGSTYDNNPSSPNAARRRAMIGCKIETARNEAARGAGLGKFGERDCNLRVMDGDSEFMLRAMRALDCPSCPYGVKGG
eukprot:CAMPEP_0113555874 /NCGR_PEP_ID=MMETSP0015_2-20120614/16952_1 /TAXON_ID=2838 /ORGANISM="Odontella" /LENGTH=204 /DNA_ID=CAMNT_0000457185 /DNA_START=149 /DNA_END=763 /DNA_ORIENTATION=+ /assembly_acc=CAM_ASM_000160